MADLIDDFLDGKTSRIDLGVKPALASGSDDIDAFLDGKASGISLTGKSVRKQYEAPPIDVTESQGLYDNANDPNRIPMTAADRAWDIAGSVASAPVAGVQGAVDAARFFTGDFIPGLETASRELMNVSQKIQDASASDERKRLIQERQEKLKNSETGIADALAYTLSEPWLIANDAIQAAGSSAAPAGLGRAAGRLAQWGGAAAKEAGRAATIGAGVGNAAMNAGGAMSDIPDATQAERMHAAGIAALGTAAIGGLTGQGVEGAIARNVFRKADDTPVARSLLQQVARVGAGLAKGGASEFVEEGGENLSQNLGKAQATGEKIDRETVRQWIKEAIPEAAAGAMFGGATGGRNAVADAARNNTAVRENERAEMARQDEVRRRVRDEIDAFLDGETDNIAPSFAESMMPYVERGQTDIDGEESTTLQVAKYVRDVGGRIDNAADLESLMRMLDEYAGGRTGEDFQSGIEQAIINYVANQVDREQAPAMPEDMDLYIAQRQQVFSSEAESRPGLQNLDADAVNGLWNQVINGDMNVDGQPSVIMQEASRMIGSGEIRNESEFADFITAATGHRIQREVDNTPVDTRQVVDEAIRDGRQQQPAGGRGYDVMAAIERNREAGLIRQQAEHELEGMTERQYENYLAEQESRQQRIQDEYDALDAESVFLEDTGKWRSNPENRMSREDFAEQGEYEDVAQEALFSRGLGARQTVAVDGINMPATNSSGQPIAATEEGIRNFWRWFGRGRIVNEYGNPIALYHGTNKDFDVFQPASPGVNLEVGHHFGTQEQANQFADRKSGNVIPVYLNIKRPLRLNDDGGFTYPRLYGQLKEKGLIGFEEDAEYKKAKTTKASVEYLKSLLEKKGYDGIVYRNRFEGDGDSYIAFRPEQIKSATGNSGAFSPDNPSILYKRIERESPSADLLPDNASNSAERQNRYSVKNEYKNGENNQTQEGNLSPVRIKNIAKDTLRGMENAPPVVIVNSMSDVVASAPADARGMLFKGKVYLNASSFNNVAAVRETVFHEVIGHYGLRGFFGSQIHPVLRDIHQKNSNVREAAQKWINRNQDIIPEYRKQGYSEEHIRTLSIEEAMAELAERGEKISGLKKLVLWLQKALRKLGLNDLANRIEAKSDAEALDVLRKAELFVRTGAKYGSAQSGSAPLFSRSQTGPGRFRESNDFSGSGYRPVTRQPEIQPQPAARKPVDSGVLSPVSADPVAFEVANPGHFDRMVRALQDDKVDLKRVQDAIREAGGMISEEANAYLTDELAIGRIDDQLKKFSKDSVAPMLRAIQMFGREQGMKGREAMDAVSQYLHARHAPERNAEMRRRNANDPEKVKSDRLSGMSDDMAKKVIGRWKDNKRLQDIAGIVDRMMKESRDLWASSGIESRQTIDGWSKMYEHYMPLYRDVEQIEGAGRPGSGFVKHATGSDKEVTNIIANAIEAAENTIIQTEKMRVKQSLLRIVENNPNRDFWTLDEAPLEERFNEDTGLVEKRLPVNYKYDDNVIRVRDGGKERLIVFNKKNQRAVNVAKAMNNLNANQAQYVSNTVGRISRHLAQWMTTRNPVFMVYNFQRDVQHALFHLQNTSVAGKQMQVLGNLSEAMQQYWRMEMKDGADPESYHYAKEFRENGGETGFSKTFANIEERARDLTKELEQMNQKGYDLRKVGRKILAAVDGTNSVVENGVRLAVYMTARKNGQSAAQAASIAKNITVNFNRRGTHTSALNSWWMFFNASLQGNVRTLKTIRDSKSARVIAGGMVAVGFMMDILARMAMGDDDETGMKRYDMISGFEKERNWIIPTGIGGKYVKVPYPQGLHILFGAGRTLSELMFSSKKQDPVEKLTGMLTGFFDAFNPAGQVGSVGQFMWPSVVRPVVQAIENKSFAGAPVAKEQSGFSTEKPAWTQAYKNTPEMWVNMSKLMNELTFGDEITPGGLNIAPEKLRLLATSYFMPGISNQVDRTIDTVQRMRRGDEISVSQIPAINRTIGEAPDERVRVPMYYQSVQKMNNLIYQIRKYDEEGSQASMAKMRDRITELGGGNYYLGEERYNTILDVQSDIASVNRDINYWNGYRDFSPNPEEAREEKRQIEEEIKVLEEEKRGYINEGLRVMNGKDGL